MAKGKKTGGREQGTPNRERRDLLEMLYEKYPNYHPIIALAEIAHKSKNEVLRFQANKELAKYVCPQLKSIEVKAEMTNTTLPDFSHLTTEQIDELIKKNESDITSPKE